MCILLVEVFQTTSTLKKLSKKVIGLLRTLNLYIIENFDDFNRVYYGDILWKTIALPSINYACAIWVDSSKQDTDKIESIQLQMARYIHKAPRNTPKEALYGDLGWVPIKVSQVCT